MWRVTPWSRKSCTRRDVATTSWATLSMMRTFHVGIGATAGGGAGEFECAFGFGLLFSDSSETSAAICESRNELISTGSALEVFVAAAAPPPVDGADDFRVLKPAARFS